MAATRGAPPPTGSRYLRQQIGPSSPHFFLHLNTSEIARGESSLPPLRHLRPLRLRNLLSFSHEFSSTFLWQGPPPLGKATPTQVPAMINHTQGICPPMTIAQPRTKLAKITNRDKQPIRTFIHDNDLLLNHIHSDYNNFLLNNINGINLDNPIVVPPPRRLRSHFRLTTEKNHHDQYDNTMCCGSLRTARPYNSSLTVQATCQFRSWTTGRLTLERQVMPPQRNRLPTTRLRPPKEMYYLFNQRISPPTRPLRARQPLVPLSNRIFRL